MATAGLFTHTATAGQALTPLDSSTSGTSSAGSSSSSASATISANDFLQLLVTEMQNQDPTDATDPNEYIDQLVDVNSLEQLIDINQTLSGAVGTSSTTSTDAASAQTPASAPSSSTSAGSAPQSSGSHTHAISSGLKPVSAATPAATISGNLSVPSTDPAAQRVAHALDVPAGNHLHAHPLGGKLAGIAQNSLNSRP